MVNEDNLSNNGVNNDNWTSLIFMYIITSIPHLHNEG